MSDEQDHAEQDHIEQGTLEDVYSPPRQNLVGVRIICFAWRKKVGPMKLPGQCQAILFI